MKIKNTIDQHCKQLRLSALVGQVRRLADSAAAEGISYLEFGISFNSKNYFLLAGCGIELKFSIANSLNLIFNGLSIK